MATCVRRRTAGRVARAGGWLGGRLADSRGESAVVDGRWIRRVCVCGWARGGLAGAGAGAAWVLDVAAHSLCADLAACAHVQHTAVKCACATAMPCTLTRPRHAGSHCPAASQPASQPARHRASQPSQRTCSWCRRIACARFGRVRRRGVVRGGGGQGGGGGVHHSCCNLLAWNSGMSAPTILTDFCLFVSEGDGLAGCGDVCSSFADQLCELVRLAKAKLARPYQPQQPCPAYLHLP